MRIAFIHPDLGIGGAERLVVDAAVGLQKLSHTLVIFTSHHDVDHCFEETKQDLNVQVFGDFWPQHIMGRGKIIFAIARQISLIFYCSRFKNDVYFVDQLSVGILLLKILCPWTKILFYCHFPDKLLTKRESWIKRIYRWPIDALEQWTTGLADEILVNSQFTAAVFKSAFPKISKTPKVLYPCINIESYVGEKVELDMHKTSRKRFLSINRFERKKSIELAIHAFSLLGKLVTETHQLVIAGGYDPLVPENVEYLEELKSLALKLGLDYSDRENQKDSPILFLPSFTKSERTSLFSSSICLLYTPSFEHFGIVPVESMISGLPVIAVNNGGPKESILDGKTGFLVDPNPQAFATAMKKIMSLSSGELNNFRVAGAERVKQLFSSDSFSLALESHLKEVASSQNINWIFVISLSLAVILLGALVNATAFGI